MNRVPSFTIVGLVESRRRRNSAAAFLLRYRASRDLSGFLLALPRFALLERIFVGATALRAT